MKSIDGSQYVCSTRLQYSLDFAQVNQRIGNVLHNVVRDTIVKMIIWKGEMIVLQDCSLSQRIISQNAGVRIQALEGAEL